ncbi:MAG: tRNA (N6-isopentenyl adenosine(37)-C2)-methylthiotransferase MiaB [Ruminococcaceae bacterium]|nr:tRNA (N6-isopentenyl adenosine(37)-C2)-methylthiotransferase MiaB [Oscillospiraceae bacterium]
MIIDINETDYKATVAEVRRRVSEREHFAYVISFGCQQNEADAERARGIALDMGYSLTDKPSEASLILINTCAIREHAEMKALSLLGNFKALKKERPELIIGILGCMAARPEVARHLKEKFHYVSFTLEPNMLHKIPSRVLSYMDDAKRSFLLGEDQGDIVEGLPVKRISKSRAWVSIMYGCNNFCTYCIVPYVRGRERSRSSDAIITECRELVASGIKEITLLGQNVNSYRSDMDFPMLLEKIAMIPGDFIIRFMTSHPKDASDELIKVMSRNPEKIAPFFHLPLQSGSDRILRAMNRTYDSARYLSLARSLREAIPDIALSTDVIIGFPGEEEEDFEDTLNVLREVGFDLVYSFNFSPREGTRAAKMTETVPKEIKDERMKRLLTMQDEISLSQNLRYVGRREKVLIERAESAPEGYTYTARTGSNKLVHFTSENYLGENFVYVDIERAGAFDLFATLVK